MSIRWKFLIILLVFSLTPLSVFAALNQRVVNQIRETIKEVVSYQRGLIIGKDLHNMAENYTRAMGLKKDTVELSLRNLVRDMEGMIAKRSKSAPEVFFAKDFDDPYKVPSDLTPSPKHLKLIQNGSSGAIFISPNNQVFWLAPDIKKTAVTLDIARLTRLLPLERILESRLGNIAYWLSVTLTTGVQSAYPGHGGYPASYDPMSQPWFILAKERGKLVWNTPDYDPFSGRVVTTVSMPIRSPDGSFAGVAAIDMLLSAALEASEPASSWSLYMRSFFVHSKIDPKTGNPGLQIVAAKDFQNQPALWNGAVGRPWLLSSDLEETKRFIKEFESNESGVFEMPYDGIQSICAYTHTGEDIGLVLLVPKKMATLYLGRTLSTLSQWQWLDTMVASMAIILVLILTAFWRSGALIKPFLAIVEAMQSVSKGDFSTRMKGGFGDERDLVAISFNEMVPQLEERIQIRKALEVAQEVQQNLLPKEIPLVPGLDISAKSVYCDETGGDYFDFFPYYDKHRSRFNIVVGDVTGHGIGAALLMATARALIRGVSTGTENLGECVSRVNRLFTADVDRTGHFITLFFLELDADLHTMRWVRAGHDPALFFDPQTGHFQELGGPGLALGVDGDFSYEQLGKSVDTAGTIIVIGTDGIWEAHNSDGEMFGKQRLLEVIDRNREQQASEILTAVLKELKNFRGNMNQEDDVTLVVIKVL
jgi:sigma-B regulation protein RsbU (phosphoserine phosphatase)